MEPSRTSRKRTFDPTGPSMPLVDRNQKLALLSIGACSDGERAIRLYGACRSVREAKSYAAAIGRDDPSCNIVLCETMRWTPVASNDLISDADGVASFLSEFEEHAAAALAEKEANFQADRERFMRAGPVDREICKDHVVPEPEPAPAPDEDKEEEEEDGGEEETGGFLTNATKRANQSAAVISLRLKPNVKDRYALQVLRFLENDAAAEAYVRNTAGNHYPNDDLYVVSTHEWLWPNSTVHHLKKIYRDELLNQFMNPSLSTSDDLAVAAKADEVSAADAGPVADSLEKAVGASNGPGLG